MLQQVGDPLVADELSIPTEVGNRLGPKERPKPLHEIDPLLGVGGPRFREDGPQQGKGHPLVGNPQRENVQGELPHAPFGAIEGQHPWRLQSQELDHTLGHHRVTDLEEPEEALEPFVRGRRLSRPRHHTGAFDQVDAPGCDQGDDPFGQQIESLSVPANVLTECLLKKVNVSHRVAPFERFLEKILF